MLLVAIDQHNYIYCSFQWNTEFLMLNWLSWLAGWSPWKRQIS